MCFFFLCFFILFLIYVFVFLISSYNIWFYHVNVFLEQLHAEYQEQGLAQNFSMCWNHSKENSTQSRRMTKNNGPSYYFHPPLNTNTISSSN